ncbi:hypothetical protein Ais01nite_11140 [Asanoa ishikariensis]|uniref:SUKH-4 immunity protein n=1 Tax=Asanoa ishikariensis TaxID=137265 RepID=A0A1H3T3R5_9ACTN|nr:hypothetical protein [Asanoa ishikariensis]GIF63079.1 hypothetical protein Ais01nite_11140 [Asanoa ishikariensis]SDZ44491.1 hypothetical protein SAMN05421684_5114 [Asanoa ishikariensis]
MEESLTDRLDDLEWWLRMLRRPVVDLLVPGLPADGTTRHGPLPPVVVEWFGWHDGVTRAPGQDHRDVEVIPGYAPLALAEAVGLRPAYEEDPVLLLGDGWLPLLATEEGDLFAALWSGPYEPRVVAIRSGEPTRIEFTDLPAMVEFFVECFRRGGFTVDADGRFTADRARYEELYDELDSPH